jgi:hypothetical protein
MKIIYISIALIAAGAIAYGIYTYMQSKKIAAVQVPQTIVPAIVPPPVTIPAIVPPVIVPYNPMNDTNYNAKMAILTVDFPKVMKGRGDVNSWASLYLPIGLADLKIYFDAYLATDNSSPLNIAKRNSIKTKYNTLPVFK